MKTRAICLAVALICVAGFLSSGAAVAAGALGQVVSPGARVDGALVPSGATLFDSASLTADGNGAVIHLASQRTLHLAGHSRAVLSTHPSGGVQVAVLAGALSYLDDDGALVTISEDENAVLDPGPQDPGQEAQPMQGQSMAYDPEEEVEVCELQNEDPAEVATCKADPLDDACEWKLIEVEGSEVQALLDGGSRLRQDLKDNYDRDCDREPGALIIIGAGAVAAGLGGGAVAVVAGSVLGAVVIANDNDPPASPIQP